MLQPGVVSILGPQPRRLHSGESRRTRVNLRRPHERAQFAFVCNQRKNEKERADERFQTPNGPDHCHESSSSDIRMGSSDGTAA